MRRPLLFLLVLSLALACSPIEAQALAVYGGKATLTPLIIDAEEGKGIMLNLTTVYGESTEESIIHAYNLATQKSGKTCRFTVVFPELKSGVEGPSAGLLFFLTFYSSEKDENLSVAATGALDENGNVLPVGGVYEKVSAALRRYPFVMIPQSAPHIDLVISSVYPGRVCIVRNVDEALDALKGKCRKINVSDYLSKKPKEPSRYDSSFFKPYAEELIEKEKALLPKLRFPLYKAYVEEEIKVQKAMMEKGYYYTAANDAFHVYSYERALTSSKEELMEELSRCLSSVSFYEEREDNVELITGAKARYYRAKEAYNNALSRDWDELLFFERVNAKAELAQGIVWCLSAKKMNVKGKGKLVNVEGMRYAIPSNGSYEGRFWEMLRDGNYLAFLFEYAFLKEGDEEAGEYSTLWGNVYASQAQYMEENYNSSSLYKAANNMETLFTSLSYRTEERNKNEWLLNSLLGFIGGVLICLLARLLRR